ncbi:MAG: restriction endonuclease subunit S, partial [Flavobacteriaceae bacterium]|nr:restriction endonuclease subunit S [Flavobacteriaceae bacterium]
IIIFNKGKKTKKVWFFDVTEDGFKKTGSKKGRRKIIDDDLVLLRQIWKDKTETKNSFFVDFKTIKDNNYKLSMNNYLKAENTVKTVKLKELLKDNKIIMGFTPDRNDDAFWFGGKHTWVTISDMGEEMYISSSKENITDLAYKANKLLPKDTLLFSFKLSIGKVALTGKPLFTNEAIAGLIITDPIIRKYLYYILPKIDYETNRATKGDTLNKETVENLEIPFEPEKIKSIVEKLDKLEKERQILIKSKEKQEKLQKEIIDSEINHCS